MPTYVIIEMFYATGSLSASLTVGYSNQRGAPGKNDFLKINTGFIYRIALGV